jgi:hypothetical protein
VSFFLHPCVAVRSGRQAVKEKEEKRKDENTEQKEEG